nr:disks large-associated protein 5-like [Equus asinus]
MRERMQPGERAEAVGSAVPKEVDHKAFDTGSFRIESPVKSFSDPENRTQAPTRERGAAQRQHAGHPPWPPCPCPPWWLSRAETGRRVRSILAMTASTFTVPCGRPRGK